MHPFATHTLHRRTLLQLAGAGGAAWLTPVAGALAREAEAAPRGKPAKSIILLWLAGGPSQLETFDPHPGRRIAAGSGAIDTAAKGIQLAAGLPRVAEQMGSISLVRSLVSKEGDHERGTYHVKTGYRPDPTVVHPSIGAIACHQLPSAGVDIPRHISILPNQWPGRGGYLGDALDAFKTYDPRQRVPDVQPRVAAARMQRRLDDLAVVERNFARGRQRAVDATRHLATIDAARRMMTSEQLSAFAVSAEPADVRAAYGDTPFGRGCLAARRLIEVGVRCVEVTLSGWDSHINNHEIHAGLLETLDPAFSALVADLRERNTLDETVVLCGGEFGRTPTVNRLDGRDHWPHNFAFALAGGGLRAGVAIGASDPEGGRKVAAPQTVGALHATVLTALGLDPKKQLTTPEGRPIALADGEVIGELLG
jgi:uncharacterized protein (DUF1501 family)